MKASDWNANEQQTSWNANEQQMSSNANEQQTSCPRRKPYLWCVAFQNPKFSLKLF